MDHERDLADVALETLLTFERNIPWLYCDRKGLVTVGIGNLVASPEAAERLPMASMLDGHIASDIEKRNAWSTVHSFFVRGYTADAYSRMTDIRLDPEYAKRLAHQRLTCEFIPGLQRRFKDFDLWPLPARHAMVDMVYSGGLGLLDEFPKLCDHARNRNWAGCAAECRREGGTVQRNDWTEERFLDAAGWTTFRGTDWGR